MIDFDLCRQARCPYLHDRAVIFGHVIGPFCESIYEHNREHIFTNAEGEILEEEEKMIPWHELPDGCVFFLEHTISDQ